MPDTGFLGGFGKPGVRITERTGGADSEFRLPLKHAVVIALIIAVGCLVVVPLLMLIIGRGLLMAAVMALIGYAMLRLALASVLWYERAAIGAVGFAAMFVWVVYGQPVVEQWWVPVWYAAPEGALLPVRVGDGDWVYLPAFIIAVRLMATVAVALSYALPAWLILQRFGIEILMPQLLAVTPNPVPVRVHMPLWVRHIEQDYGEPEPLPVRAGPEIIVEWPELEPQEREIAEGVAVSNGMGNHGRRTTLPVIAAEKWEALTAYVLTGRSWAEEHVARGNILTKSEYRDLTRALLECHYLDKRQGASRGYAWTPEGLAFLRHRLWRHV